MILLSGHSLTQARRIPLEGLSLSLKERESTANMTPADMTGISLDSWFLDDTEPGKGIVWRVTGIQNAYAVDTPTVRLEHVISTLKDRILFGSYEPADISGGDTVTVRQAISWVLSRQSDWKLGRCEFESASPFSFDGETLFDAIGKVTDTLDGAWWDLDTSSYPFVLNIIQKPAAAVCEMRPGRNLSAVTKTIDKSGMYTRFYPIGADDLHISGEYISKNENLYGVIDHVEVDQEIQSEAELRAWATERLNRHAEPTVSVTAEGVELAEATGESLDRLTLGRVCRIPLQEFGTIIEERIVAKEYPDKLRQPENVRITLSNQQSDRDVLHMLADEIKNGAGQRGRGGRSSSRQSKEDHAWIEDTESHVALCAVGIIGKDADGNPNWVRLSRLEVNEGGIYEEVKTAQNDIVTNSAAIRMNEKAIQQEVLDRSKQGTELNGKISVQADRIDQEVQVRKDEDVKLDARITTEATQIKSQVSNMDSRLSGQIAVTDRTASMSVGRVKYSKTEHYANKTNFPATGVAGTLYYADDTRKAYLYMPGTHSYELAEVDEYGNANYIKAGEIAISINESGNTEAKLNADVIYAGKNTKQTLAGLDLPDWMDTTDGLIAEKATIVDLKALDARVETLEADTITTKTLSASIAALSVVNANGLNATNNVVAGGYAMAPIYYIGSPGNAKSFSSVLTDASVSGNTLTITKVDGTTINFSKATTLRGAWGSDKFTVTASPQNVPYDVKVTIDQNFTPSGQSSAIKIIKPSATGANWLRVQQQVGDLSSGKRTIKTIVGSTTIEETEISDASDAWSLARGKVSIPSSGSGGGITAKWPGSSYNTQDTRTYTLMEDGYNIVGLYYNSAAAGQAANYVKVAQLNHNEYTAGRNSVKLQEKYVTSNGDVYPDTGYDGMSKVTVDVPTGGGEISIPRGDIYTTDRTPSGTNASTLRNNYEQARSDGDYVVFHVTCGDASRWYYMEP